MCGLWALVYHGVCVEIRSGALTKCNFALQQFPVYVLPKVEYQGCYGVEALTESELCRFWTESLLHSNCSFYVGESLGVLFPFVIPFKYLPLNSAVCTYFHFVLFCFPFSDYADSVVK